MIGCFISGEKLLGKFKHILLELPRNQGWGFDSGEQVGETFP